MQAHLMDSSVNLNIAAWLQRYPSVELWLGISYLE